MLRKHNKSIVPAAKIPRRMTAFADIGNVASVEEL